MMTETETGVMQLQVENTKDGRQQPETRRAVWGKNSPSRPSGRTNPTNTLISDFWPREL